MAKPRIGLALGSGGARGFCHIGVLKALRDRGVIPDLITGCSMGALVGAAAAGGRLEALEDWARGLTNASVLTSVDVHLTGGGLLKGAEIARLLDRLGLPEQIEDLDRPFAAVATDLATGREVWFETGSLATAVRSSVSIPGVFAPYHADGTWLLDGGLVDPVPVGKCRDMGADLVLAVNPNSTGHADLWAQETRQSALSDTLRERFGGLATVADQLSDLFDLGGPASEHSAPVRAPNYFDVVSVSIDIMTMRVLGQNLARDPPDHMVYMSLRDIGVLELYRADEAIEAGAAAIEACQAELDRLLRR